jgi:cytochrome c oxidase subunit 2
MLTSFHFTPTITTEKMREITKNPDFDYVLLCNKICGVAHYNMNMKVVIHEEDDFNRWLNDQKNTTATQPANSPDTTAVSITAIN